MSIQSNNLSQVADKLSNLVLLSSQGEESLYSLQTSSQAVGLSVGGYRNQLVQYNSRIKLINAAALNSSAQDISHTQSQIENSIRVQGPDTEDEFARVRVLALQVEMALGLLENIQLTILDLVPQLETQRDTALSVLVVANDLLSGAQFNYSSNILQAMKILSSADAAHHQSVLLAGQLFSQESQIALLNGMASSLNSSLQVLQHSLNRLVLRNSNNSELITATRNSLLRTDTSETSFYDILNNSIVPQIQEIQVIIQSSIDASNAANEYYAAAAQTLNGSLTDGHEYNLESGDSLISERISSLRTSQADLNSLLLRVEAHQQELTANTTRIETYYNETHLVALEALAAITDYREVTRLITEACALANTSLQAATAAVQESAALVELGVLEQVELELKIARNLLNFSIALNAEALTISSVELLALKVSINQTRDIISNVELALIRAKNNLDSILNRVPFFSSRINDILIRLPDLNTCIDTNSSSVVQLLSELRRRAVGLVERIINCSVTIQEYDAQGTSANILVNTTVNALIDRVHAISNSVRISDSNMAALQTLQTTVGNIESIRDRAFAAIATLKVALSLKANSTLTYPSLAANVPLHYTQVSIYFMPTITTGVLFYIQTGSGNFVSLQLEDGVLTFYIDLGLGPVNVSIGDIALHQWYQVLATRDNQQLTISLSSQQTDSIETRRVDGTIDSSLSLLFPPGSTIYLGHVPGQDGTDLSNFEGCVSDLIFNHMPVPLFKPIAGSEYLTSCGLRPVARSYDLATWFYGGGYLFLEVPELFNPLNSSLTIFIRTLRDGTLLYAANPEQRTNITLTISQGRVRLEIGDGEQSESLYSNQFVTDNTDHTVSILRDGESVSLQVNSLPVSQLLTRANLSVGTSLRIGSGAESAVAQSFSGVITGLIVNGILYDLRQATNVSRTIPFSPTYVTHGSFHISSGYAQFPLPQSSMSLLSIDFSFRTTTLTGLLLLLFADDSGSSPIHLTLEHGSLTISYLYLGGLIPRQGVITLDGDLNEGEFHSVRIDFLSDRVRLSVDRLTASSSPLSCFNESSDCDIRVSTPLYVGGVPDFARLSLAVVTSYRGCIRDLRINDVMYNYTEADILSSVSLYGCEPAPEAPLQTSTFVPTATSSLISPTTTLIQQTITPIVPSSSLLDSISSSVTRSLIHTSLISSPTLTLEIPVSPTLSSSLLSSSVPIAEIPSSSSIPFAVSSSLFVSASTPLFTAPIPESSSLPFSSRLSPSIAVSSSTAAPVSSSSILEPVSSSSIAAPVSSSFIAVPISSSSIAVPVSSSSIAVSISSSIEAVLISSSTIPTAPISSSHPLTRRVSPSIGIPQSSSSLALLASPTSRSLPPTIVQPSSSPVITSSLTQPSLSTTHTISVITVIPTSSSPVVSPPTTPTPTTPPPDSAGYRFDGFNNSYVLLDIDPSELATDTIFRIELSSITYNGIIFFVNGLNNFDFIELKFLQGRLQFSFSLGSTPTRITTTHRYDDGARYRIEATRLGPIGLLSVLEVTENNHLVPREYFRSLIHDRAFTLFDLSNNFYFGGLPNQQVSADMCVTSLLINTLQRLLSSGAQYRVNRCYSKLSSGATFSGHGSYIQLFASFYVGREFTAQFEFRTFNRTGLLFYIANSVIGDHLTVELRNGSVLYSVDNGKLGNANIIAYTPASPYYLSNGLWHSLSLTKLNNYITLIVDGVRLESSIDDILTSVDTSNYPLLLGGLRPGIAPLSHVTKVSFTGCIREVLLNDEFVPLNSPGRDTYRVQVAGCIL